MGPESRSWGQRYGNPLAALAAAATATVITAGIIVAAAVAGAASDQQAQQMAALACPALPGTQGPFGQWHAAQMTNAAVIAAAGQTRKPPIPVYGEIIAEAAAMQESHLINLGHGPQGSLGLFQQRPAAGWGTRAQILRPAYAASQFYTHLLAVHGWQQMPLTQAAQAVQHSGHPHAYAKWQKQATQVIAHLTAQCQNTSTTAPNMRVAAAIAYARHQLGCPYLWGGTGPCSPGFDCSGLVMKAYQAAGISIPRTSQQQWTFGPRVPASQAEPGDLVFFVGSDGTPTAPGHVGLVIGGGKMIEAYATGFPVRISPYGTPAAPAGDQVVVGFTRPWSRSSS
jgi:cell wall-associated NlpC family hydrolase